MPLNAPRNIVFPLFMQDFATLISKYQLNLAE